MSTQIPGPTPPSSPTGEPTPSMMGRLEQTRDRWRGAIGAKGRHECRYCNEAFTRVGYLELHKGRRHGDRLDESERVRFEQVQEAERLVMGEIALHTKCGLFALPLFLVWAAVLVLLIEMGANIAWLVMSTPGYVLFAGLIYVMAYGYQTGGRTSYYGHE